MNSQTLPKRGLGVGDQVLVADLEVLAEVRAVRAGLFDPLRHRRAERAAGSGSRWPRSIDALVVRERHVAAVADHVDESRLGQDALDPAHRLDVGRRLVAPALLALLLRVELVEGAKRVGAVEAADRLEAVEQLVLAQAEVVPAPVLVLGDRSQRLLGAEPEAP